METEFKETQRFSQWWLWLLLLSILIYEYYGAYKHIYMGEAFGDNPMPDSSLMITVVVVTAVVLLFLFVKLTTTIDASGIKMYFFPFKKKKISWDEVKNVTVLNYGFVGGWGVRLWTKYGTVYNIKGNKGLFVELKNGNKFLIGTQKEEELAKVIEFYKQQ